MNPEVLVILIQLTDLNGGRFDININTIATLHDVTGHGSIGEGGNCAVATTDGKAVAVQETCDRVRELIAGKLQ